MSNALAIAAVTSTLRYILDRRFNSQGSGSVLVTTKPLDKAREQNGDNNKDQVNLFLYQTRENAAWKNMDLPSQVKLGETGQPPLALNLYYLLTAYAQNEDYPDPTSHTLLGEAMSAFHDYPILNPQDIQNALPTADLGNQIEKVRITTQPLNLDELSKLWTTFQTQYRISTAYEVSVVLIDSTRLTKTPPPVLSRGAGDFGVTTQADLISPYPTITTINFDVIEAARENLPAYQKPLLKKPTANLGDNLTLIGNNWDGDTVQVLFNHPQLSQPNSINIAANQRTATEIKLTLPTAIPNQWPAGFYTITVVVTKIGELPQTSNSLALAIAPVVSTITFSGRDIDNNVIVQVTCTPPILARQRVGLILSSQNTAFAAVSGRELLPVANTTLDFVLTDIPNGTYQIRPRLRVDGVDSQIVNYTVSPLTVPLTLIPEVSLSIP
ncbi:DUF4255 domain-containing protein [Nostoc sp. LEGE 12447]|uniref:DUF4255 domain-containing protein n=1 Tax=Nostoc sp. LEGE 12447 TaxID=1828640 RepID=UPI001684F62F|nr:DUF4255 domain-containing protein [Nostoc sp. LEGE 12447]MBD2511489.1 DUF4255 domain-containing protein [Desmonostoc muscorum FACHB-395]MBE9001889.1 DUF4255 domain-containing protein [Nostoc sp. LEGE 12447]